MTLPSRRTLLLAFGATLLVVIPAARVGGEQEYCRGQSRSYPEKQADTKSDEETVDLCTGIDFGMTDAIRWSTDGGLLMLIIAAWSYSRDRRQATRQLHPLP